MMDIRLSVTVKWIQRCLLYVTVFSMSSAFNLDTHAPIVKRGSADSYFGFSLTQHYIQHPTTGEIKPVILVGAPRDNITDSEAPEKVRQIVRPGVVYQCPFTSDVGDCDAIKVNREEPSESEDLTDQWMGVSVASQGTDDGRALICAHRYKLAGPSYRWGVGQCYSLTNALDEEMSYGPCEGLPRERGHGEYGFCQAGVSAALSKDGTILVGAPGPYNWRGTVFKNRFIERVEDDAEWFSSPVEDEDEPTHGFFSYLGMSVKIATVSDKKWYIAGSPRSKHVGQVFMFQDRDANSVRLKLEQQYILTGEQFGAGFGYDVAVADFNLDQKEDIVVSAPFYHATGVGGAIYIFYNSADGITALTVPHIVYSRKMKEHECAELNCQNARFGYAMAHIGDVDRDGFQDLAVGAPYEGHGAVYIFRGSARGLVTNFQQAQRIVASDFASNSLRLSAFGASLAGGADLDNNGYPDLAVGAFASNAVVILRARPVVSIFTEMTTLPHMIDPRQTKCLTDGSSNVCFELKVCFRFTAEPRERFDKRVQVFYRLEAEKFADSKRSRVVFVQRQQRRVPESSSIEGSVLMKEQSNPSQAYECETILVYISKTNTDFLNPALIQMSYRLEDKGNPVQVAGEPIGNINDYPVLNGALANVTYSVDFVKNCGDDHLCHSGVAVYASMDLERDGSDHVLRVGQNIPTYLTVDIENTGEDAHDTTLTITLPESIGFHSAQSLNDNRFTCQVDEDSVNVVKCPIGNPFIGGHRGTLKIRLDMQNAVPSNEPVSIVVQANTTSIETDLSDNLVELSLIVIVETDLLVRGRSNPDQVVFGGEVIGESAIEFEDKIGFEVVHIFEVRNIGNATVPESSVLISWPYETASGQHVLYLLDEPATMDGSDTRGFCHADQNWINPLRIKLIPGGRTNCSEVTNCEPVLSDFENWPNTVCHSRITVSNDENSNQISLFRRKPIKVPGPVSVISSDAVAASDGKTRQKRDVASEPANLRVERRAGSKRFVRLNCDDNSARCHQFRCEIGILKPKAGIAFRFRSRLWNSTFVENFASYDEVRISSKAVVKIDPKFNIKQISSTNDVFVVETVAVPDIFVHGPQDIPLWIIIVSVIAGIVLLVVVIIILWKCGFFRRNRMVGTHKAEKKHAIEDYHD